MDASHGDSQLHHSRWSSQLQRETRTPAHVDDAAACGVAVDLGSFLSTLPPTHQLFVTARQEGYLSPAQLQVLLMDDGLPPFAPGLLSAACRRLPPPGIELVDVCAVADAAFEQDKLASRKTRLDTLSPPKQQSNADLFPSDLREISPGRSPIVPCADPKIAAMAPHEARQELLGVLGRRAKAQNNDAFGLFRRRDPGEIGAVPVSVAIVILLDLGAGPKEFQLLRQSVMCQGNDVFVYGDPVGRYVLPDAPEDPRGTVTSAREEQPARSQLKESHAKPEVFSDAVATPQLGSTAVFPPMEPEVHANSSRPQRPVQPKTSAPQGFAPTLSVGPSSWTPGSSGLSVTTVPDSPAARPEGMTPTLGQSINEVTMLPISSTSSSGKGIGGTGVGSMDVPEYDDWASSVGSSDWGSAMKLDTPMLSGFGGLPSVKETGEN